MAALISVLATVTLSLLITRIASEAMVLTGLSAQAAQFQARSAFTGAGFTTKESEQATNHPVRRQIIMWLMLLGNAGIVTVVSSLVLTFVSSTGSGQTFSRLGLLAVGFLALWAIATDQAFNRFLTWLVQWALQRWTQLDVRDYASLLRLSKDYTVSELHVEAGTWLANKRLEDLQLGAEGVVILGIQRQDGIYVGAPQTKTLVVPGDLLTLYGRSRVVKNLDARLGGASGEKSHEAAIAEQKAVVDRETLTDITSANQFQQMS
ncbi:TrkA C-terminal domain-containing protein [cf. Phormidesmis sp. LEGE 11477]|uniref:TrkA C-terminal domain-containing protein n=1 Tax=cf. Phormidesmis sp. LEGE 11477 TaxID=1828680 RepID=UPI001880B463|nr:TrkA C-terminal domain-containing protein [cf. Phormidesmis sp. LEGE 11477]MBE9063647.1 TrkA C-terminal domain-containing protein [cf. Phormidesmis sp. LEGE 11477]